MKHDNILFPESGFKRTIRRVWLWLRHPQGFAGNCSHLFFRLQQRPLVFLALPALTGTILATTVTGRWMIGITDTVLLAYLATRGIHLRQYWQLLVVLALFSLGACRLGLYYLEAEKFCAHSVNQKWSGEGVVVSRLSEYVTSRGVAKTNTIVRIQPGLRIAVNGSPDNLKPGNRLALSGYLKRPEPAANPGGFNQQDWLWRQGVLLELDQSDESDTVLLKPANASPSILLAGLAETSRARIHSLIEKLVGQEQSALLFGLLVGDASGLSKEVAYHFRQAGLSHLTAVSGANIAFWLSPMTALLRRFRFRRFVRQSVLLAALVCFGFLTGWQVSVSRAIIMSALFLFGRLLHRRPDPLNSLGLVILIFMVFSPFALLSFGFWLSLLATVALIASSPVLAGKISQRWPNLPKMFVDMISLNLSVQLLVLPVSLVLSHQVSLVGLVANIPAVLIVEWVTAFSIASMLVIAFCQLAFSLILCLLPGFLAPAVNFAAWIKWIGQPVNGGLTLLLHLSRFFSRLDFGRWPVTRINLLMALGILAMIVALNRSSAGRLRHWLHRMILMGLGSGLLLAQITPILWTPNRILFLSVGQGDATLILTRSGQTILIDSGPPNSGWDIILPVLDSLGRRRIDLLIITHGHSDHAGGVSDLLVSGRVDRILGPAFLFDDKSTSKGQDDMTRFILQMAAREGIIMQGLHKNDTIRLNSGRDGLRVLSPDHLANPDDQNEQALHFMLDMDSQKILLMSDCTAGIEDVLLSEGLAGPVQILKVAHHGSRSTTRQMMLDAIKPKLAVISVGYNNYGHPSPELLNRLRTSAIKILRTDRLGAIQTSVSKGKCFVKPYRKDTYG